MRARRRSANQWIKSWIGFWNCPKARGCIFWRLWCAGRKGEYKKIFEDARKKGFARARINGQIYNLDETEDIKLERYEKQDIEIVVDRIVARESERMRIADSVQTTLKMAEGIVMVEIVTRDGEPAPAERESFNVFRAFRLRL